MQDALSLAVKHAVVVDSSLRPKALAVLGRQDRSAPCGGVCMCMGVLCIGGGGGGGGGDERPRFAAFCCLPCTLTCQHCAGLSTRDLSSPFWQILITCCAAAAAAADTATHLSPFVFHLLLVHLLICLQACRQRALLAHGPIV